MSVNAERVRLDEPVEVERVLGRVQGARPGPTLLCVAGLHGNEPAGVLAARRVLERLAPRASLMRGDFVALAGNRRALAGGCRFVERDLNRAWTDERLDRLRAAGRLNGAAEDQEQVELLDAIEEVVEAARGPVYVLDLHTTSGTGGPFTTFGDTLPNRTFASNVPVPMVLGIEELLEGTLLAFLGRHGLVAAVFESGQHDEPAAVDRAEAGIWLQIAGLGLLPERRLPEARGARIFLRRETDRLPRVMEMRYRHPIGPGDQFRMNPGWRNFQAVERGQPLARDVRGDIVALQAREDPHAPLPGAGGGRLLPDPRVRAHRGCRLPGSSARWAPIASRTCCRGSSGIRIGPTRSSCTSASPAGTPFSSSTSWAIAGTRMQGIAW